MIEIGQYNELTILRDTSVGLYLGDDSGEDVLLPNKYRPEKFELGDSIEVFVYRDHEERKVATNLTPKITLNEFALLQVTSVTEVGAFLDWGLDKDLFVPFAEQHRPMEVGKSYIVHLYLDVKGRITASSKIDKFLQDDGASTFRPRQRVSLIIANSTDLGYKVIVNHTHWGVLYKDEVFERLSFGQSKQGFIKRIRPDGRLDITLHGGKETKDKNAAKVLEYLKTHNGTAPLHDKSPPAEIEAQLAMSKAAFKKAISSLYKERVIIIEKDGIRLV